MKQCNNRLGFTLIELIVVIAIVGILATFVVTNVNSSLKRARDAERINSLKQIQTALELYYQDNGSYPETDDLTTSKKWKSGRNGGRWIPELTEKYIKEMPVDPKDSGCDGAPPNGSVKDGGSSCYDISYYSAIGFCNLSGQGYLLVTRLEATDTTEFSQKNIIDSSTGTLCNKTCDSNPVTTWSECPVESLYVLVNP